MSERKFPSGGWSACRQSGPRMLILSDGVKIAELPFSRIGSGKQIQNAHLIAAAPELYKALLLLVRDVQDYETWRRPCHAVDVANAALAKARGETE